jgi:hypothetical protein
MTSRSFVLLFCASLSYLTFAQDIITKRDGVDIEAEVLETTDENIKYKKFDFQDGPTYTEKTSEILIVRYENWSEDIFLKEEKVESVSAYKPNVAKDFSRAERRYENGRSTQVETPFNGQGVYFSFGLTTRVGTQSVLWPFVLNPGVTASVGYNINPKIGVGFKAGSDMYWHPSGTLDPLGIECIYRLKEEGSTLGLEFSASTGYAIARSRGVGPSYQVFTGGPFLNPGIGISIKEFKALGFYMNINTMLTRVTYENLLLYRVADSGLTLVRTGLTIGFFIDKFSKTN